MIEGKRIANELLRARELGCTGCQSAASAHHSCCEARAEEVVISLWEGCIVLDIIVERALRVNIGSRLSV